MAFVAAAGDKLLCFDTEIDDLLPNLADIVVMETAPEKKY